MLVIARKSALIVATNFSAGLLNYVALYLIARYYAFPKFVLGLLNFAVGFVALFNMLPNLGFPLTHIKRISEGKDIGKCNATFFSIRLVLTALMVIAVISSIFIWKNVIGRGFQTPEQEKAVYVMLCYYILLALSQNFITTYRAKMEIAVAQLPFFTEAFVRTVTIAYFVFSNYGAIWIVYAYVIGGFVLFLSTFIFFKDPVDKATKEYFSSYLKFAIPISLVPVSFILMMNLDKVLIQLFWGYEEGADYFSIVRLSRFINNVTAAFGTLLLPTMSAMYAKNKMDELQNVTLEAERYISMILMPVVFLLIFLAKPTIYILLTKKFYSAIPILQILPLFAIFDALGRPYQTRLLGMDLPKFERNRIFVMVLVNVILNIILIPRDIRSLGIKLAGLAGTGAAMATVIAYFSGLIYIRMAAYKISKLGINKSVIKHAAVAIIAAILTSYINKFYIVHRWYDLLFLFAIGFAIYILILTAIKEFRKEDFNLFIDTINPKKMVSYIMEEIKGKRDK